MEGMFHYFIPDDGDSPDHLNVFPLPKASSLTVAHLKKDFPLPGEFHFRFKMAFEGTYVWLDAADDEPVPEYNGVVISKISRISKATETIPVKTKEVPKAIPPPPKIETPAAVPDLIETSTPSAKETKVFHDDLVGLMSTPPTSSPRVTSPTNQVPSGGDPFNLFATGNTPASSTPMRPPTPHAHSFQANPTPSSFPSGFPMNNAPRPAMNNSTGMNISNMNMNNPMLRPQQQQPMNNNGFNNLQWNNMMRPPPNQRTW
ncbi:hypothetical protein THRCLA_03076 [Thraustotheca clavata]|uniref:DIX domain-containing protein n=1 Tax=Thraustotheca clavata TaxID=74557 RepID=A0A1W0A351_9STRA|nr:hypothetical protein THRCLA_03076 [Thraustotheca clavata]